MIMSCRAFNKKMLSVLVGISLLLACSACTFAPGVDRNSNKTNEEETTVELTQRQIDILKQVGLPTDFEELTVSQRHDIDAIEKMLCYLEETYQVEATYEAFYQGSTQSDEELRAVVGNYQVTVTRKWVDGKYVYSDNYPEMLGREDYEAALKAFFTEKGLDVKVYADEIDFVNDEENILSRANTYVFIFVRAEMEQNAFEELVMEYGQWYAAKLNGIPNSTRIYLVSDSDFSDVARSTYMECLQEVSTENQLYCIISLDGSVSLH